MSLAVSGKVSREGSGELAGVTAAFGVVTGNALAKACCAAPSHASLAVYMPSMPALDRVILTVPTLAIGAAVAFGLLAPATMVCAVRIHAGPLSDRSTSAWRIELLQYQDNRFAPVQNTHLALTVVGQNIEGRTDDEGVWEATVAATPQAASKATAQTHVTLRNLATGQTLIDEPVHFAAWNLRTLPSENACHSEGPLRGSVTPNRGMWATGYPEIATVQLTGDQTRIGGCLIHARGDGAIVEHVAWERNNETRTNHAGQALLRITPKYGISSVQITATCPDGTSTTALCEVLSRDGQLWLDPNRTAGGSWLVRSPVAHRYVYVTLLSRYTRVRAWRVSLGANETASIGPIFDDVSVSRDALWLSLSPDPPSHSQPLDAWPISADIPPNPRPPATFTTPLAFDSTSQAKRQHAIEQRRFRPIPSVIMLVAAWLEAALLAVRLRLDHRPAASLQLIENPATENPATDASIPLSRMNWRVAALVACLLIGLAFAALALLLWVRP